MEGKAWWQSTAMRAGLLGIIMGGMQIYCAATGKQLDLEALRGTVSNALDLLFGAGAVVLGFMALIGRFKATEPIKPLPWLKDNNQPKE